MNTQRGPEAWQQIAEIWAQLAKLPINAPDASHQYLLDLLVDLTDSTHACTIFSVQSAPHTKLKPDPLSGWRLAYKLVREANPAEDPTYAQAWAADPSNIECNPIMKAQVCDAGQMRALLRQDLITTSWDDSPAGPLHRHYDISDRMTGMYPVSDTIEMWFLLERRGELPEYGEREQTLLLQAMAGVGPLCLRLAMSFGLLEAQLSLTPRERETLLHLLDSKTERDIAEAMGLTVRSAHQNVVSVFRKMNVKSRAELMAMWMSAGTEIPTTVLSATTIRSK